MDAVINSIIPIFIGQNTVLATTDENKGEALQDELVNKQMDDLGINDLTGYWQKIVDEYGGFLPDSQKGKFS